MTTLLSIFRSGTHTAMSGHKLDFGEADLAASAAAYDPALHEAPLVVGHPKADGPAYGWVKSLAFAEGALEAEPQQVDEAFQEMVNAGRFKKISACFYRPDAPANPVPGVYYLRHVGFLGAQPPSVKGLRDASFADSEDGIVSFGDWEDTLNAGLWRRLREWFIGKHGLEEADKALPGWDIDQLKTLADQPDDPEPAPSPAYAEEERMKQELERREAALSEAQAKLDADNAAFAERVKALDAKDATAHQADCLSFAEGLVKGGKLNPAQKEPLAAFLATLPLDASLSFGEGDAAKSEPTLTWFKSFLSGLPAQLAFGEAAGGAPVDDSAAFAAPQGYTVDAAGLELHARATAHQKAHPDLSFIEAVKAVSKEA